MENLPENIFIVFQILLTGGYGTMTKPVQILVFILSILFGVTIVAILVGLITDSVAGYMTGMSEGRSKVVDSGHTLILGCVRGHRRARAIDTRVFSAPL